MNGVDSVARLAIVLSATLIAAVAGALLFVWFPGTLTELLGLLLALGVTVAGLKFGGAIAGSAFPTYDVAEVAVEGPITRDGGRGPLPTSPTGIGADDIAEQIERADEDDGVDALLLKLNTPGGEVVPSDDIRRAAAAFDGPTIAYTNDLCASGGYWIAAGCDELWAREASVVGSIGVIGSRFNASDLADRLGISYERFVAGEYKDAGTPFRDLEPDEREYIQDRVDEFYEQFVERVAEGRDLDEESVRDTEARVFLGEEAEALGLVDELGTRDDVEARVADQLGVDEVTVEEFAPERGITERLSGTAGSVAYAFGAGVASVVTDQDRPRFR